MATNETCPRCGQATIEVKDWGTAGKLFVHKRGIENGIPVQDACHVHAEELTNGPRWTHQGEGFTKNYQTGKVRRTTRKSN